MIKDLIKNKERLKHKGFLLILSSCLSIAMPIFVLLKTPIEKSADVPLPPWFMSFILTTFVFLIFGSFAIFHLIGYLKIKKEIRQKN